LSCERVIEIWHARCILIKTEGNDNDKKGRTQRVSAQLPHPVDLAALPASRPLDEASGHPR